jgi:hypothetical protein
VPQQIQQAFADGVHEAQEIGQAGLRATLQPARERVAIDAREPRGVEDRYRTFELTEKRCDHLRRDAFAAEPCRGTLKHAAQSRLHVPSQFLQPKEEVSGLGPTLTRLPAMRDVAAIAEAPAKAGLRTLAAQRSNQLARQLFGVELSRARARGRLLWRGFRSRTGAHSTCLAHGRAASSPQCARRALLRTARRGRP